MLSKLIKTSVICLLTASISAEDIKLPKPEIKGGKPLMEALKARKTSREFSPEDLSSQQLSNLLWAAWGFNRPDQQKRTAPSAHNWQDMDVYVVMKKAAYVYDAQENKLKEITKGDGRVATGFQQFCKTAPINLVYVSDQSTMKQAKSDKEKDHYSAIHAGLISQNVNLYCASTDLATVVRGWFDATKVSNILQLPKNKKVILCQTVGKPAK